MEKVLLGLRDFVIQGETTRRNAEDVRELRKRVDDLGLLVERLAFEIRRVSENEAHEREKLLLRLGLPSAPTRKQMAKKKRK